MSRNKPKNKVAQPTEGANCSDAQLVGRIRRWSAMLGAVRGFFAERGFVEVDTPLLLVAPAQEAHIEPIAVAVTRPDGQISPRYLQPSPELMMKRLLASGVEQIYQVAPVFRDGDDSPSHAPEFRLLEWYRRGATFEALMEDCEALIEAVAQALGSLDPALAQRGRWPRPYRRIRVEEAFLRHAGFSPLDEHTLAAKLAAAKIHHAADDSPSELFGRVFAGIVEPKLRDEMQGAPFFLTHYPAYEAALAQLSPSDPRVAERFELYGGGLELANAFGELTCATEQRARFVATRTARAARGQRTFPLDEAYLAALEPLGQAAGIALGLERLMMALLGEETLLAVRPWLPAGTEA